MFGVIHVWIYFQMAIYFSQINFDAAAMNLTVVTTVTDKDKLLFNLTTVRGKKYTSF